MGRVIVSDFNINKQVRTIYYTDIIGLASATVGTIMLATKVTDGVCTAGGAVFLADHRGRRDQRNSGRA